MKKRKKWTLKKRMREERKTRVLRNRALVKARRNQSAKKIIMELARARIEEERKRVDARKRTIKDNSDPTVEMSKPLRDGGPVAIIGPDGLVLSIRR